MPIENILVLGLILAVFGAFSGTLAWVSRYDGAAEERRVKQTMPQAPITARHA